MKEENIQFLQKQLKEINESLRLSTIELQRQLESAQKELEERRAAGENI